MVKSFSGVFLLILFLFPQVQKQWHDFEHRHESHCNADAEVHFHAYEHSCKLCDFSLSVGLIAGVTGSDVLLSEYIFEYAGYSLFAFPEFFHTSLPARAPPAFG